MWPYQVALGMSGAIANRAWSQFSPNNSSPKQGAGAVRCSLATGPRHLALRRAAVRLLTPLLSLSASLAVQSFDCRLASSPSPQTRPLQCVRPRIESSCPGPLFIPALALQGCPSRRLWPELLFPTPDNQITRYTHTQTHHTPAPFLSPVSHRPPFLI